ncbi:TPA: hypothetical protein ACIBH9_001587 [Salmonella enterica subsp. diarizonae serovar 61:l,v:z35]
MNKLYEIELRAQQLLKEANREKVVTERRRPVNPLLTTAEKLKNKKSEEKAKQFALFMLLLLFLFATAYNDGVIGIFITLFSAG